MKNADKERERIDHWLLQGMRGVVSMLDQRVLDSDTMATVQIHEFRIIIEKLYEETLPKLLRKA